MTTLHAGARASWRTDGGNGQRALPGFGGQASTGGLLLPSGSYPGGTSVLYGETGRWVSGKAQEI